MSDTPKPTTVERDALGRLLPGSRPQGAGISGPRTYSYGEHEPWARKLISEACRSEAPEVLPKLKALIDDPRPRVSILAMEAILRLAYGKPSVARLVKDEVYRLTGRHTPYTTIRSWPDGKLKDLGSPESADLLDTTGPAAASLRPSISTYIPPLDPQAVIQAQLQTKRVELQRMTLELAQAGADLRELRDTVSMAQKELEAMEATHATMPDDPCDPPA